MMPVKPVIPGLALAAILAAGPAVAASYTIDHITINGAKSVSVDQLRAALKLQPGAHASTDEIIADQDNLEHALEAAHVTGSISVSLADKHNGHADVIFAIQDTGVQAPQVTTVAPKLDREIFVGNVKIPTDQLTAASGLAPGEDLSDTKIAAAQTAIAALYKKADIGMNITGANTKLSNGTYDVTWTIVETKAKKKKRDTEDEGGLKTDQ